jgi:hypothetical protein
MISSSIISAGVYFKNTKQEDFDLIKFLKTVLLSGLVSMGALAMGVSDNEFATSIFGVFLSNAIEPWLKSIIRSDSKLRVNISRLVDWLRQ